MDTTLLSPQSLDTIERQLAERGAAIATVYDHAEKRLADLAARHEESLKTALSSSEPDERQLVRDITSRSQVRELNALRRQVRDETEENRRAILMKIDDYEKQVEVTEGLFKSPVQVLSRHAAGDQKKTEAMSQLAGAGPAELQTMADYALATGDRVLASACLIVADRDPKKYSQFDRPAFAANVVGPEVEAMKSRLAGLKVKIQSMRQLNRAFEKTGEAKMSPNEKIALGVAKHNLAKAQS